MSAGRFLVLAQLITLGGCGGSSAPFPAGQEAGEVAKLEQATGRSGELNTARQPAPEAVARKIIYRAEARLVVEDFEKAEQELLHLLKTHQGYVARAEITGKSGTPRQGQWTVRVPVEQFDPFLEGLPNLGVPQRISRDSDDVTERYFDLEARLKVKKAAEGQLLKLLEKADGNLKDHLELRRELKNLREEIEEHEGQLRRLANLTALTTVTVHLHEVKGYVPPQAPTFGESIRYTFRESLAGLAEFGKGLVLFLVALTPWLPVILAVGVPLGIVVRRRRSASRGNRGPGVPATLQG